MAANARLGTTARRGARSFVRNQTRRNPHVLVSGRVTGCLLEAVPSVTPFLRAPVRRGLAPIRATAGSCVPSWLETRLEKGLDSKKDSTRLLAAPQASLNSRLSSVSLRSLSLRYFSPLAHHFTRDTSSQEVIGRATPTRSLCGVPCLHHLHPPTDSTFSTLH